MITQPQPILPLTSANPNPTVLYQEDQIFRILFIGTNEAGKLSGVFRHHDLTSFKSYPAAAYHLQHLSDKKNNFPDIIIGNKEDVELKQISGFTGFLAHDPALSAIPFILMGEKNREGDQGSDKPIAGVDDIIPPDISMKEFATKITLLKKFKSLKHGLSKGTYASGSVTADRKLLYKIDLFFKRLMDILISSLTLLILSPILLIIALIIKIDSKGPVFYLSYRAGSNYKIFKFIKFRTMVADADKQVSGLMEKNQYSGAARNNPVFFKVSQDPRVTRFGRFLRNTSIDELPQLFNILKGDMCLVGNRPLPLYEAKTLTTDDFAERFNAPAGLTGLWQVSKRGKKKMSADERIALDIDYARKHSFFYDLRIIASTPKALFQKDDV